MLNEREWLFEGLRPGETWRNKHTGETTVITRFDSRVERVPNAAGGFRDDPQLVVHHTVNAPPGFAEGHGEDATSFAEHWAWSGSQKERERAAFDWYQSEGRDLLA